MNCCDYDCTQGRDCPVRAAKVASVGRRVDVSRVQLIGADRAPSTPGLRVRLVKRIARWAGALAVVAIWMLACAATDSGSATSTPGQQHAQWEAA